MILFKNLLAFKYSVAYLLCIVLINAAFSILPLVTLPDESLWSWGSMVAGLVFIARDYAQREIGHIRILVLMAIAGALSALLDPEVAVASLCAFAVSELTDYAVYTISERYGKSFTFRVILSSVLSVPVDTFIFLSMMGLDTPWSLAVMTLSKLIAILLLYVHKEK